MNILDLQDKLKGLSQQQLVSEMQMPSGQTPQYLVLSEITRRKSMRDEMAAREQQGPQQTVAEEAVAAAGMPQQGLGRMAMAMAPQSDVVGNSGIGALPQAPQGMPQAQQGGAPVQRMQEGGLVGRPEIVVRNGRQFAQMADGSLIPLSELGYGPADAGQAPAPSGDFTPSQRDLDLRYGSEARASQPEQFGGLPMFSLEEGPTAPPQRGPGLMPPQREASLNMPASQPAPFSSPPMFVLPPQGDGPMAPSVPVDLDLTGGLERGLGGSPFPLVGTNTGTPLYDQIREGGIEDLLLSPGMTTGTPLFDQMRDEGGGRSRRPPTGFRADELLPPSIAKPGPRGRGDPTEVVTDPAAVTDPEAVTDPAAVPPRGAPAAAGSGSGGGSGAAAAGKSSYEQELTDAIGRSEKRAEQDKWLALAQAGLALMSSKEPTLGGALGEAGATGLAAFRGGRDDAEESRMKLLEQQFGAQLAQQQLAMARARAAGGGGSGGIGGFRSVDQWFGNAMKMSTALGEQISTLVDVNGMPYPATVDQYRAAVRQKAEIDRHLTSALGVGGGAAPAPPIDSDARQDEAGIGAGLRRWWQGE